VTVRPSPDLTPLDRIWLTEAVRLREEHAGPLDDDEANRQARTQGGDLPALIERAQHDDDADVRRAATGALVYAAPEQVGPALIGILRDEHWQVRVEAAVSIGKLDYQAALQPLVEATHDSFWQVREKAVDALGKLGAVGAIPALGVCARDPMSNLRKAAIGALGAIAHNDGRPFVELAMDDPDPDVRKLARWAMSKLDAAA